MTKHNQSLTPQTKIRSRPRFPARPLSRSQETSPQDSRGKNQVREFREAVIRAVEDKENERKFILSFSSEEPYKRFWGNEVLDHSPEAVDLTRLNENAVLLFNHNRDKVLGRINRAWVENYRGMAEVEFDKDAQAEVIYQKVKSGTLKGVSVGYRINVIEEVSPGKSSTDGRFAGPCNIARRWEPYEISIASVPADITVGVGREEEGGTTAVATLTYFEAQIQVNKNRK